MLTTPFTRGFGVLHPIIQAGMASDCGWELASAVSKAGALGTIGSIGRSPRALREEIARCREATDRPFAVNVCCFPWAPFHDEMLEAAIAEWVPAITLSFGDVVPALRRCHESGIPAMVQVQTMAAAREVLAAGADLLIVQGHEAGGHTGTRGTLSFAAEALGVAGATPIAVAGGIGNGRGLAAVLAMGAAAAVMGTRFKATPEFGPGQHLGDDQKTAIVASDGDATVHSPITDIAMGMTWPHGIAGRVLANDFTAEWLGQDSALRAAVADVAEPFGWTAQNNQEPGTVLNWAGESAGVVDRVRPAAEVVEVTAAEAEAFLRGAATVLG